MTFEDEYQEIKNKIGNLDFIEIGIKCLFKETNPFYDSLSELLTSPAKRLRPLMGSLFLKCIFEKLNHKQEELLLAVELIHSATLIHDDVIDNSNKRRQKETLNAKFDNNLAVIAGDFLLSAAMEKIINTNSIEVIKLCTSALKSTCLGESKQYFNKFKITSIEEYIEKTKEKTALLFEIAILGGLLLSDNPVDDSLKQIASDFAKNFGIAFQIRDDLKNILNSDDSVLNDIDNGIYTAPVIFAYQEDKNILESKNMITLIKRSQGIEKTKNLMDNYYYKSSCSIENLGNNKYKKAILAIMEILKSGFIEERLCN